MTDGFFTWWYYGTHVFIGVGSLRLLVAWKSRAYTRPGLQLAYRRRLIFQIGFKMPPTVWPLDKKWRQRQDAKIGMG